MEFELFIDELCEILSSRLVHGEEIRRCEVLKNNGVVKRGINILNKECNMSPTIYLESFFEQYKDSGDISILADEIESIYRKNACDSKFDVESFFDYEKISDKLTCRIINKELNGELLKNTPYEEYMDLALIVCIQIEDEIIGNASITVKNEYLSNWGISKEILFLKAKANTRSKLHVKINRIGNLLANMNIAPEDATLLDSCDPPMYVLSNDQNYYGAVNMIYDDVMDGFCQLFNEDALVIPSSVHEVIVLPSSRIPIECANEMIYEVNRKELLMEERLSDHAYLYRTLEGFSV